MHVYFARATDMRGGSLDVVKEQHFNPDSAPHVGASPQWKSVITALDDVDAMTLEPAVLAQPEGSDFNETATVNARLVASATTAGEQSHRRCPWHPARH